LSTGKIYRLLGYLDHINLLESVEVFAETSSSFRTM